MAYMHMLTVAEMTRALEIFKGDEFTDLVEAFLGDKDKDFYLPNRIILARYQSKEERIRDSLELSRRNAQKPAIYLQNCPFEITKEDIKDHLQCFGNTLSITLLNSQESIGKPPCAICSFQEDDAADAAISAGGVEIQGLWVRITRKDTKRKWPPLYFYIVYMLGW